MPALTIRVAPFVHTTPAVLVIRFARDRVDLVTPSSSGALPGPAARRNRHPTLSVPFIGMCMSPERVPTIAAIAAAALLLLTAVHAVGRRAPRRSSPRLARSLIPARPWWPDRAAARFTTLASAA